MRRLLWVVTAALAAGIWIAPAESERRKATPPPAATKPAPKPSRAVKPSTPAPAPQPSAAKRKQGAGSIYGTNGPRDAGATVGRPGGAKSMSTNTTFKQTSSSGGAPDYQKAAEGGQGSGSGSGSGSGQSAGSGK